jgi:hypothetical protein
VKNYGYQDLKVIGTVVHENCFGDLLFKVA